MIIKVTDAYTRQYRDNGQVTTYVEWLDAKGTTGRTEGDAGNPHMAALLSRAAREGIAHRQEIW